MQEDTAHVHLLGAGGVPRPAVDQRRVGLPGAGGVIVADERAEMTAGRAGDRQGGRGAIGGCCLLTAAVRVSVAHAAVTVAVAVVCGAVQTGGGGGSVVVVCGAVQTGGSVAVVCGAVQTGGGVSGCERPVKEQGVVSIHECRS